MASTAFSGTDTQGARGTVLRAFVLRAGQFGPLQPCEAAVKRARAERRAAP